MRQRRVAAESTLMSYSDLDLIIHQWAAECGITILTEEQDPYRRFGYITNVAGDTFQIVVEPERGGLVRIDAHLIESLSDRSAHFVWEVSASQAEDALDLAGRSVRIWLGGERRREGTPAG